MIEGIVIRSSGEERVLQMFKYCRPLRSMMRDEIRVGGLDPERIMTGPAASSRMVHIILYRRRKENVCTVFFLDV